MSSRPLFDQARAVVRSHGEADSDFARRVDRAVEIMRQTALDHCAGHYPKLVVHFSEDRTEAVVNCTVVSWR